MFYSGQSWDSEAAVLGLRVRWFSLQVPYHTDEVQRLLRQAVFLASISSSIFSCLILT